MYYIYFNNIINNPIFKEYKPFVLLTEQEKFLIPAKQKDRELYFYCIENEKVIDVVREPKDFKLADNCRVATQEEINAYNEKIRLAELAKLKEEKHNERRRLKAIKEGLYEFEKNISTTKEPVYQKIVFQSDDKSINRLDAKININNFETTIWIAEDNNEYSFTKEELISLVFGMRKNQDVVAFKNAKISREIDGCTTKEELNAVVINFDV